MKKPNLTWKQKVLVKLVERVFPGHTIRKVRKDAGYKKPTQREKQLYREDN